MPQFTDRENRVWSLELDFGMIEDIQATCSVDLDLMMTSPEKFTEVIFASPRKLVEMLCIICQQQMVQLGVTPEAFGRLFKRDILDLASNALLEAIVLFYPRSAAGKAIGKKLPLMLAKMDKEIEKRTNEHFDRVLSEDATS